MISLPTISRSCGSCSACCSCLAIPELSKGNHSRCSHQERLPSGGVSLQGACKVYPERPPTCQSFRCHWLNGVIDGDERRRPDRLGLMFASMRIVELGGDVLAAWEVWSGAVLQEKYLLDKLARKYRVAVVTAPPDRAAFFWDTRQFIRFTFQEDGWVLSSPTVGEGESM